MKIYCLGVLGNFSISCILIAYCSVSQTLGFRINLQISLHYVLILKRFQWFVILELKSITLNFMHFHGLSDQFLKYCQFPWISQVLRFHATIGYAISFPKRWFFCRNLRILPILNLMSLQCSIRKFLYFGVILQHFWNCTVLTYVKDFPLPSILVLFWLIFSIPSFCINFEHISTLIHFGLPCRLFLDIWFIRVNLSFFLFSHFDCTMLHFMKAENLKSVRSIFYVRQFYCWGYDNIFCGNWVTCCKNGILGRCFA